jgi:hypothetical protein
MASPKELEGLVQVPVVAVPPHLRNSPIPVPLVPLVFR